MGTVVSAHEVSVQFNLNITLRKSLKLVIASPDKPPLISAGAVWYRTHVGSRWVCAKLGRTQQVQAIPSRKSRRATILHSHILGQRRHASIRCSLEGAVDTTPGHPSCVGGA